MKIEITEQQRKHLQQAMFDLMEYHYAAGRNLPQSLPLDVRRNLSDELQSRAEIAGQLSRLFGTEED